MAYSESGGGSLRSSGSSLVATLTVNLQSQVRFQQSPKPMMDCQSLDGMPTGMVTSPWAVL